jgi:N-ethylmaleimide reductase
MDQPRLVGWHDVPGLFTDTQVRAWSAVTDAVHREGGVIFVQLWHSGSSSHPDFFAGTPPLAPSGNKPTVTPRAMTQDDIRATISDYAAAAANAMRAGFDGVQLQAGFNYLISQFLNPRTNLRTDAYGGSIVNRARLLFDMLDAVGQRIDIGRVGVNFGHRRVRRRPAQRLPVGALVVDGRDGRTQRWPAIRSAG